MNISGGVEETYEMSIVMTKEEAMILKSLMQNPWYGDSVDEEPEEHREIRRQFFTTLQSLGV